jgi:hypothetical protein
LPDRRFRPRQDLSEFSALFSGFTGPNVHDDLTNQQRRSASMNVKTKLAACGIGFLALGGSGIGVALSAGAASAAPTAPASAPVSDVADQTGATGAGPDVQAGDQSAPDGPAQNNAEVGAEPTTPSDGPGGHQDPTGNVDNQATGVQ